MSVALEVAKDEATPLLRDLLARVQPARLGAVLGRAGANVIKRHLEGLPSNKRGWPTTNFYKEASRQTSHAAQPDGAVITIAKQGFRQRLMGGPIKPRKPRGRLTIPARAEAGGKRAIDFDNLTPGTGTAEDGTVGFGLIEAPHSKIKIRSKNKQKYVERVPSAASRRLFFFFSRGVTQQPDPSVLPTDAAFLDALTREVADGLPAV